MNTLRQQPLNHRTCRLDLLAPDRLQVSQTRRGWPLRILLAHRRQLNPARFSQQILDLIDSKCAVAIYRTARRQIEVEDIQRRHICGRARHQKHLHRLALWSGQQEDFYAVEVAPLAGRVTAKLRTAKTLIPFDSDVIASRYGKAVDEIKRCGVELFEGFSQHSKNRQEQVALRMQAA